MTFNVAISLAVVQGAAVSRRKGEKYIIGAAAKSKCNAGPVHVVLPVPWLA